MIYVHGSKWYERPLLCLLGRHDTRPHPSPGFPWEVCNRCDGEREVG